MEIVLDTIQIIVAFRLSTGKVACVYGVCSSDVSAECGQWGEGGIPYIRIKAKNQIHTFMFLFLNRI